MLSVRKIDNSKQAGHYFSAADYYIKGEDNESIKSQWNGKLAQELGLEGSVNIDKFVSLLDGHLEDQVLGRIGKNGEIEHKSGWDFTFSAPKSVSILGILGGDSELLAAHEEAVKYSLSLLESKVITRKSIGGIYAEHQTEKALFASFTHTTSRELDPQLHTHNVLINATKDSDKWSSIESKPLYDSKMATGMAYRVKLAELVRDIGYDINFDTKTGFFEIDGVSEQLLSAFSKRSASIRKKAEEVGVTDSKSLETIAVNGRSSKKRSNTKERFIDWEQQLKDNSLESDLKNALNTKDKNKEKIISHEIGVENENEAPITLGINKELDKETYKNVVKLSFDILHERECSISKEDIIARTTLVAGMKQIKGFDVLESQRAFTRLQEAGKICASLYGKDMYTSPEMLKREEYIVKLMLSGKGSSKVAASLKNSIEYLEKHHSHLNESQLSSAAFASSSKDQFIAINGSAGVGKTTMTKAIKDLYQISGFNVKAFAPTNGAANVLQNEIGVESNTLASHLMAHSSMKGKPKNYSKDVWLVDESSLMNNESAADLMTLARRTKAKVIMLGDKGQLAGVEAGKPFELLLSNGVAKTYMDVILRQRGNERLLESVKHARDLMPEKALSKVRDSVTVGDVNTVVDEYLHDHDKGEPSLLMIPDNDTRIKAMLGIRSGLVDRGVVDDANVLKAKVLMNNQLTRPEKSNSAFYRKNDIVEFGLNFKKIGVTAGERYQVIKEHHSGEIEIAKMNGDIVDMASIKKWNPSLVAGNSKYGVEVYKAQEREISKGDNLVIKKTVKGLSLKNGMRGNVVSVHPENQTIKLDFGKGDIRDISLNEFKHIDYSYAVTIQTAQGMTHNKAIFLLESWRKNLVHSKAFYVAISRAKLDVSIHTDNASKLASELEKRRGDKTASHSMENTIKVKPNISTKKPVIQANIRDKAKGLFEAARKSLATGKEVEKQHEAEAEKVRGKMHEQSKDKGHSL